MRLHNRSLQALVWLFSLGAILHLQAQNLPAPSNLTATASVPGDMAITLFWDDNSQGEEGFEVQRMKQNDAAGFVTIRIVGATINSMNDVGLEEHTTYVYRVRAITSTAVSAFSNEASATTTYLMPAQISNLAAVFANSRVSVTWKDNATNETHIDVERVEVGGNFFEVIATLPPNSEAFTDATVKTGTSYIYRIRPWRFTTFTGAPDTVTVETGTGLAAPADVNAKPKSPTSIEINWRGRYPQGTVMQIQTFDLDTGMWNTVTEVNANWNRYVHSGLERRTQYFYRVRLVSATSVSAWVLVEATTRP